MMSRNGNPVDIECLQAHLSCGAFNDLALEGELVYSLDKATREHGNGIITKIVKNTATEEEKDNAMYQVWDCISLEHYQPKGKFPKKNSTRRLRFEKAVEQYSSWCKDNSVKPKIFLIERHDNVTVTQAFEIFEQYVREGYEGAIAKDMDAHWLSLIHI